MYTDLNKNHEDKQQVLIEKYRNFEIFFNREDQTFYCVSDYYDTESKKKTYAAAKTAIDLYIKENVTFKPFYVIDCKSFNRANRYKFPISNEMDVVLITGIRKDNRFVSNIDQISEYDEKEYFLKLPENEPVFLELAPLIEEQKKCEEQLDNIRKNINLISNKLNLISLTDYKKMLKS